MGERGWDTNLTISITKKTTADNPKKKKLEDCNGDREEDAYRSNMFACVVEG